MPVISFIKTGTGSADFSLPGGITAHVSARGIELSDSCCTPSEYYEIPLKYGENVIGVWTVLQ